jgi:hypothetical protein
MELTLLGLVVLALALTWALFALSASVAGRIAGAVFKNSPRRAQRVRLAKWLGVSTFAAFLGWQTYFAIYPDDAFYLLEYQTVTGRLAPPDAEVLEMHASYPDLHGDYCSFSRISLPPGAYTDLMRELSQDSRFDLHSRAFISTGVNADKPLPGIKVVVTLTRNDTEPDHHHTVQFLEGGRLVEVHLCVT